MGPQSPIMTAEDCACTARLNLGMKVDNTTDPKALTIQGRGHKRGRSDPNWLAQCRQDNSTVPSLPIQHSYGTHSHTMILTFNSILFWPVKAVGNRITIGTYNMSHTPQ